MRYILIVMVLFGLAACQNEEKGNTSSAPAAVVEQHKSVSTQAVKKDEVTPPVVQENMEKSSQAVARTLEKAQMGVESSKKKTVVAMTTPAESATQAVADSGVAQQVTDVKAGGQVAINEAKGTVVKASDTKAMANNNPHIKSAAPATVPSVVSTASSTAKMETFNTKKCKACHSVSKNKVGPAWKDVAAAYGDAATLAAVFKSGFNVGDRKVIASNSKWKGKAGIMTGQYKKMIKGHEDAAAQALFDAVAAGKL
jgi:cytochrome c551/c552